MFFMTLIMAFSLAVSFCSYAGTNTTAYSPYHSSGHKHNMLHEKNGTIGVGISGTGYSKTWAQMFSE
jgi:uncharacterized protein YkwD